MPNVKVFLFSLFILIRATLAARSYLPSIATPLDVLITPNLSAIIRREREVIADTNSDYLWKATKMPAFVTTQMKKQQAEPILTAFSSEGAFRNGKSREIFLPEYNVGQRNIYHTTLPDVPHHPTRSPYNPYGEFVGPLRSDQRSYDAKKIGHEFVRVQSAIINVAGKDKTNADNNRKSDPSFVIVENSPPYQYPVNGLNKFVQQPADYDSKYMADTAYRQRSPYHDHQQSPYHGHHHKPYISDFKLPYSSSLPHYNAENNLGIPRFQHPYQHQSSPYYEEIENLHANVPGNGPGELQHYQNYGGNSPITSPPYPSRHVRFPTNRYPQNSPYTDLLSSPKPHVNLFDTNPQYSGILQHSLNPSFGGSLSTNPSSFDFNNNLGPVTMDHNSAFDDNRFGNTPLSLRNKFLNSNRYSGTSSNFHSEFPFNSQFSDKPFDWRGFGLAAGAINDGVTRDKNFHIKGTYLTAETQNEIGDPINATADSDGTKIQTTTQSDTNTEETETNSDYGDS